MNPSSNEAPGFNLPPPMPEQASGTVPANPEMSANNPPEVAPQMPSTVEASGATAQAFSLPVPPAASPKTDDSTTTASIVPITTDKDLIDKATVDKAKAIIERTKDNPYQQSEEMTVFKADHLYKSYNRKIKTK